MPCTLRDFGQPLIKAHPLCVWRTRLSLPEADLQPPIFLFSLPYWASFFPKCPLQIPASARSMLLCTYICRFITRGYLKPTRNLPWLRLHLLTSSAPKPPRKPDNPTSHSQISEARLSLCDYVALRDWFTQKSCPINTFFVFLIIFPFRRSMLPKTQLLSNLPE